MNKYELLQDDKIEVSGHILYRIRALKDFKGAKAGDLGGYIEGEKNLSHRNNCWVFGNAYVFDNACVCGEARVCGNAYVFGNARVCGNAKINKISDVLCISSIGSRNDFTTFFKTENGNICVKCGCFSGTIDRFLETVNKTHGENRHAKAYKLACELARVQIELED